MKKIIAFLLVAIIAISLVACGGNTDNSGKTENPSQTDGGGKTPSKTQDGDKNQAGTKPKGYSDGNYWYIRSGVWDTEFLPDILPAPLDDYIIDSTTMKDLASIHDALSANDMTQAKILVGHALKVDPFDVLVWRSAVMVAIGDGDLWAAGAYLDEGLSIFSEDEMLLGFKQGIIKAAEEVGQ